MSRVGDNALDEFSDFQSSPSSWLINKFSGRTSREALALRAAILDEVLTLAAFGLAAWAALDVLDRRRR